MTGLKTSLNNFTWFFKNHPDIPDFWYRAFIQANLIYDCYRSALAAQLILQALEQIQEQRTHETTHARI